MEKTCRIDGCKREYRAKGYCNVHYKKWRRGELEISPRYKICGEEGCNKPMHRKGKCEQHYSAWSASKKPTPPEEVKVAEPKAEEIKPETEAKVEEKSAEEAKPE